MALIRSQENNDGRYASEFLDRGWIKKIPRPRSIVGMVYLAKWILENNPNKLIIIEKDFTLYKKLLDKFNKSKITIINDDAMVYNFSKLNKFNIISNLPYNISSKFLLKVLKLNKNFTDLVCMIQSELADKLDYQTSKMNKYKFISEYCASYKVLFNVSPNVFYPKPKVNSKVVKFKLIKQIRLIGGDQQCLEKFEKSLLFIFQLSFY